MKEGRLNEYFLYMEMILAAPGAKLHRGFRTLRKSKELSGAVLFGIVLLLAGTVLWQFRGNNTWLLILAGVGLVTIFSFVFSLLRKHFDTLLGIGEMLTYPFHNSYEQCRENLKQRQSDAAAQDDAPKQNGSENAGRQSNASDESFSQNDSASSSDEHFRQTDNSNHRNNSSAQENRSEHTGEDRFERESSDRTRERTHRRYRTSPANARLDEAKAFFGVDIPFTMEEIKQRRNQLIKKYHPDNPGGSEEMCKKINECYALLVRYVS